MYKVSHVFHEKQNNWNENNSFAAPIFSLCGEAMIDNFI